MRVLLIVDDQKAAGHLAKGLQEEGFVIDVRGTGHLLGPADPADL